ncbi:hypothetical protein D3C76_28240 [compost metagenome]
MSRWVKGQAHIHSKHKAYDIWIAPLHYQKNDGLMHYNKIEMYAHNQKEVERLQNELLGFLQSQEMCGITHG